MRFVFIFIASIALPLCALAFPPDPFRVNDNRLEELLRTLDIDTDPCEYTYTDDTTYISGGTLYGDHRWTKDGSPYLLEGDVTVDSFSVLGVDAGVEILFEYNSSAGYRLNVDGNLQLRGEIDDSIFIGPKDKEMRDIRGFGAVFIRESAPACSLEYCIFQQAATCIVNVNPLTFINGCNFKFLGEVTWGYPTGVTAYKTTTIRNCTFQGLAEGEEGQMIDGIYVAGEASYLDVSNSYFYSKGSITIEASDVYTKIDSSFFCTDGILTGAATHLSLYQCIFVVQHPNYPFFIYSGIPFLAVINCTVDNSFRHLSLNADSIIFINNNVTNGVHYGVRRTRDPQFFENIGFNNLWNNQQGDWAFIYDSIPLGVNVTTNANGDSCDAWGNISVDPLFVDADNLDFHLQEDSPLIDAGDPSMRDPDGTVSDIGAFCFNQSPFVSPENDSALSVYPSPFTDELTIFFQIQPIEGNRLPRVEIFNIIGRKVMSLPMVETVEGYAARWDATDYRGYPVNSGMYIIRLRYNRFEYVRKLVRL